MQHSQGAAQGRSAHESSVSRVGYVHARGPGGGARWPLPVLVSGAAGARCTPPIPPRPAAPGHHVSFPRRRPAASANLRGAQPGAMAELEAGPPDRRKEMPWSLAFGQIHPTIRMANRRQLSADYSELLRIGASDECKAQADFFDARWEEEIKRAAAEKLAYEERVRKEAEGPEKSKKKLKPPAEASAFRAMWPSHRKAWLIAVVLRFIETGMVFASPIILQQVIEIIVKTQRCAIDQGQVLEVADSRGFNWTIFDPQGTLPEECVEVLWPGYALAATIFAAKMIESVVASQQQMIMTRIALRMRSSLVGALYRKCLNLAGLSGTSTGQVQNLMATDAQMFLQLAPMCNTLFLVPIQLLVTMIWLAFLLGPSFLAGLAIMIAAVPLQAKLVTALFKARAGQQRKADERVKLINEVLQGVRVVKLYAWEQSMKAKIDAVRKEELKLIRKQRIISSCFVVLLLSLSTFVTVVTFSTYALAGNSLRAGTIVTAHLLLTMLRFPLAFGPVLLIQLGNFMVSMKRISRFMMNKELDRKSLTFPAEVVDVTPPTSACIRAAPAAPLNDADGVKGGHAKLKGSFFWDIPEIPAKGKGKGKGKGAGAGNGRGGRALGGRVARRSHVRVVRRGGRGSGAPELDATGQKKDPQKVDVGPIEAKPQTPPAKKPGKDNPTLRDLDLEFSGGKLTMIVGAVGSGKSSVLSALLGELQHADANTLRTLNGRIAFVAQSPFILNATVRDNILFGNAMDEKRYQATLEACALLPDLKILPGGDMTQIGERGINLSGGQKARVTLARAVYDSSPIVLLDDPLSAVDAHVGKHLFRQVLSNAGVLSTRTRILVTHQTQYIPLADEVVLMEGGRVVAKGTYKELVDRGTDFGMLTQVEDEDSGDTEEAGECEEERDLAEKTVRRPAESGPPMKSEKEVGDEKAKNAGSQIVQDELRATGAVSLRVYLDYVREMGGLSLGVIAFFLCSIERVFILLADYWLPVWIEADAPSSRNSLIKISRPHRELEFWIPLYFAIAITSAGVAFSRSILIQVVMGVRACRSIFAKLLASVLNARMVFFETTPTGRVLNRFTSDTEQLDVTLLMTLTQWLNAVFQILGTLTIVSVSNPFFLAWLLPLALLYYALQAHVRNANRDLKRLETVSRSPIFAQFSETLNGISTIRAYGATQRFRAQSEALVDSNTRCYFSQFYAQMWMSMRLDVLGSSVVLAAVLLPLISTNTNEPISPALAGIAISYSVELCQSLKFLSRISLDLEQSFASIERIDEYVHTIPQETNEGNTAPTGVWPSIGRIEVNKLCVRYRPELPLVLQDVDAMIEPTSKVGIVGRTGSGKSTFVSALWRLVELSGGEDGTGKGSIIIDGCDIRALKLTDLRSRLAIIPQDPVLFSDTVRYNLDPFGVCSAAELDRVLKLCQLESVVAALPEGTDHKVAENGSNFSVGQRQLICLARATLRHSAVLVLDEATASMDNDTDALLQQAIRDTFSECTVLTIAHRLHTIMDSTQVMLFEAGKLIEYDDPHELLCDPRSQFSLLVNNTGSAAEHLRQIAAEASEVRKGELSHKSELSRKKSFSV